MFKHILTLVILISAAPLSHADSIDLPTSQLKDGKDIFAEEHKLLQRHQPFYFAFGRPLTKMQVSFKTPIVQDFPLYFAYTQLMFWELESESKPFRDLTYNPELFYRWGNKEWKYLTSVDFGFYGHTSNGKEGKESRSIDSQYLRLNWEKTGAKWVTRASLQAAYMHSFDPGNRDYLDYVGPVALKVSFVQLFDAWIDKSEASLSVSPAGHFDQSWDRGGYQVAYAFRFRDLKLNPSFYMQYYHGYAETLVNYNRSVDTFRVGFIF